MGVSGATVVDESGPAWVGVSALEAAAMSEYLGALLVLCLSEESNIDAAASRDISSVPEDEARACRPTLELNCYRCRGRDAPYCAHLVLRTPRDYLVACANRGDRLLQRNDGGLEEGAHAGGFESACCCEEG